MPFTLPRHLTHTRSGTTRLRPPRRSDLTDEDIAAILAVRDQLLHLFAPARYSEPLARVRIGVNARASYWTGTREWHPTVVRGEDHPFPTDYPYLVVNDRNSTHMDGTRGTIINDWEVSLRWWTSHILGGANSILTRWDLGVDGLTSLLIDVDHPKHGRVYPDPLDVSANVRILSRATDEVLATLGVELRYQIVWTGGFGLWLHIHTNHIIGREQAARFVVMLASRWRGGLGDPDPRYIRRYVVVDGMHLRESRLQSISESFHAKGEAEDHRVSFCGGNLTTRPVRMPLARHQDTGLPCVYMEPSGGVVEDQIGYLMDIQRQDVDLGSAVEGWFAREWFQTVPGHTTQDVVHMVTSGIEDEVGIHTTKTVEHIVTSIPGDRYVVLVSYLRGLPKPGDPLPDQIKDGDMNRSLVELGGLLWLYDQMRDHGEVLTVTAVVDEVMRRYVNTDPRDTTTSKRAEVDRIVRRDFRLGRHRWVGHRCVEVALRAAAGAEVTNALQQDILIALTHRGWYGGTAYTIAEDLARQCGILEPMNLDPARVQAARMMVGRALKVLIARGLITQTRRGKLLYENGRVVGSVSSAYRLDFKIGGR